MRVEDGMALQAAKAQTIAEAWARGYRFGLIALDRDGGVVVDQTEGSVLFGYGRDGNIVVFIQDLNENFQKATRLNGWA